MKTYQEILNHHFNIIGLFNLNAYENDMPLLYAELKKIKKVKKVKKVKKIKKI
mgnify:CR=1 FL=1